jgi:hypothetical protein
MLWLIDFPCPYWKEEFITEDTKLMPRARDVRERTFHYQARSLHVQLSYESTCSQLVWPFGKSLLCPAVFTRYWRFVTDRTMQTNTKTSARQNCQARNGGSTGCSNRSWTLQMVHELVKSPIVIIIIIIKWRPRTQVQHTSLYAAHLTPCILNDETQAVTDQ